MKAKIITSFSGLFLFIILQSQEIHKVDSIDILIVQEDYNEAISRLNIKLKDTSNYYDNYRLGLVYQSTFQYNKSIKSFLIADSLKPEKINILGYDINKCGY